MPFFGTHTRLIPVLENVSAVTAFLRTAEKASPLNAPPVDRACRAASTGFFSFIYLVFPARLVPFFSKHSGHCTVASSVPLPRIPSVLLGAAAKLTQLATVCLQTVVCPRPCGCHLLRSFVLVTVRCQKGRLSFQPIAHSSGRDPCKRNRNHQCAHLQTI